MTSIAWGEDRKKRLFGGASERWQQTPNRTKNITRVLLLLALVGGAYHYSLWSLFQTLGLDTPLAYVGLVPIMALLIAAVCAHPNHAEPPIHDRQVDYIVGVPLLALALAINIALPGHYSSMFWVWRIDLLSLPFFVAGAVSVIFGVRVMWRQRLAIGFLFLAWPLIYEVLLLRFLTDFTNMTLSGLRAVLHLVHVATPVVGSDGSLFQVAYRKPFPISVVSACSGVNGMVGFLLVGTALGAVVRGPRFRKALWLAGGLVFLWVVNLFRLVLILWVGAHWGEKIAIQVLHPFIGLVTFNIGVVILLLMLRPIGLSVADPLQRIGRLLERRRSGGEAHRSHAPRLVAPLALVLAVGIALSFMNSGLKSFDLVANAVGTPRLASFADYPATPAGWRATLQARYTWATPFFGADSSWLRYTMGQLKADAGLRSTQSVTADVIQTSNLRTFSAYGVEACYRFHGYALRDIASVRLSGGITGQALSYHSAKDGLDWTVVYWIWPVRTATSTRYERVTLFMLTTGQEVLRAPRGGQDGITSLAGGSGSLTRRLTDVRAFLVQFARSIISGQASVAVGTRLPPWRPQHRYVVPTHSGASA